MITMQQIKKVECTYFVEEKMEKWCLEGCSKVIDDPENYILNRKSHH